MPLPPNNTNIAATHSAECIPADARPRHHAYCSHHNDEPLLELARIDFRAKIEQPYERDDRHSERQQHLGPKR
uniref:Uncharacterized protein n=1 Tax=Pristionchus pacificus TaxID=54126 RepID=A0A2A6CNY8_PRIPA|eukprot:PDM79741.1 hypothetical protein PRIPAC_32320 [Pristionchus pacificus]